MKSLFRILTVLVCLAALAAGLIYYVGGKQIQYVVETRIESTVETVMEHLTDPDLVQQWGEGLVQLEPDPESGDGVGAHADLTILVDGRQYEMDTQLLSSTDSSLTIRTTCELFDSVAIWQLIEESGSVTVRNLVLTRYKGWERFPALFTRSVVEEQLQVDMSRLKALIETGRVPDARNVTPAESAGLPDPLEEPGTDNPLISPEKAGDSIENTDDKSA